MTAALIAILAIAAFLFVVAPLFEPARVRPGISSLGSKIALDAIEDLDLEYAAGKISEDGYKTIRSELVKDAALLLARKCGHCNVSIKPTDLFCGNCGERTAE